MASCGPLDPATGYSTNPLGVLVGEIHWVSEGKGVNKCTHESLERIVVQTVNANFRSSDD